MKRNLITQLAPAGTFAEKDKSQRQVLVTGLQVGFEFACIQHYSGILATVCYRIWRLWKLLGIPSPCPGRGAEMVAETATESYVLSMPGSPIWASLVLCPQNNRHRSNET